MRWLYFPVTGDSVWTSASFRWTQTVASVIYHRRMHVHILCLFYFILFFRFISFWGAFRLKSLQHHPGLNSDRSIWSNPQLCMPLPSFRGKERRVISVEGDLVNGRDIRGRSASVSAANSDPSNLISILLSSRTASSSCGRLPPPPPPSQTVLMSFQHLQ